MTCSISKRSRGFGIIITALECGSSTPMDLSTATDVQVSFEKGDVVLTDNAPLLNDGKDGAVAFITPLASEYFSSVGTWKVEIVATFADGVYPSEPTSIIVSS